MSHLDQNTETHPAAILPGQPHLTVVADNDGPQVPARIADFFARAAVGTPALVIDLDLVEQAYNLVSSSMPGAAIYYAVKANPAPEVLRRLHALNACFDVASRGEIELCLAHGIEAERLSFGSPLKKRIDIEFSHQVGVTMFAADSEDEVRKIAEAAPGAEIQIRISVPSEGASWPLSRKFGCPADRALELIVLARDLGAKPTGISFHVGSQQTDMAAWDRALTSAAPLFDAARDHGIELTMLNMGGGVPARTRDLDPHIEAYGATVMNRLAHHFGDRVPQIMIEPGRSIVANAGVIEAEVVTVAQAADRACGRRWVYLDIGRYSGLAETMDEAIQYCMVTSCDGGETEPTVLAGPTCDSSDTMYEANTYDLPKGLKAGDKIWLLSTGAYTTTYSSVAFNGFKPLETFCI